MSILYDERFMSDSIVNRKFIKHNENLQKFIDIRFIRREVRVNGSLKIVFFLSGTDDNIRKKKIKQFKNATKKMLVILQQFQIDTVNCYVKGLGESVGYVNSQPIRPQKRLVSIVLGASCAKYRPGDINIPEVQGGCSSKGYIRLVGDQIYDYYKPARTINAENRMIFTNIMHEYGHVMHQLSAPREYLRIVEAHKDIYFKNIKKYENAHKRLLKIGRQVSFYAQYPNSTAGIPDFVAETFASLMVGLRHGKDVREAYLMCGGFVPPYGTYHIRKSTGRNHPWSDVSYR